MRHLAGAGALAGIGFTMSLFIAGRSFPDPQDFVAAKAAIFLASAVSAIAGCLLLSRARSDKGRDELSPGRLLQAVNRLLGTRGASQWHGVPGEALADGKIHGDQHAQLLRSTAMRVRRTCLR